MEELIKNDSDLKDQNLENKDRTKEKLSPIQKLKIETAHKSKQLAEFWIDHYKYMQNLKAQMENFNKKYNEKKEAVKKIASFENGEKELRGILYKICSKHNESEAKLENYKEKVIAFKQKVENNKEKLNEEFQEIKMKYEEIENKKKEVENQKKILSSLYENIENLKKEVNLLKNESSIEIENLSQNIIQENIKKKELIKEINLLSNITNLKIIKIDDENKVLEPKIQGHAINPKDERIMNYSIKIGFNVNKVNEVKKFWKNLNEFLNS